MENSWTKTIPIAIYDEPFKLEVVVTRMDADGWYRAESPNCDVPAQYARTAADAAGKVLAWFLHKSACIFDPSVSGETIGGVHHEAWKNIR